ncbi:MAG: hypothetical protein DK306_001594 [Chloroflexi bacterium]|nr:MAG: hypothetical protein DK306_001594 [Chloroflexota bacterium]
MPLSPSITDRETETAYARLRDRVLDRDQPGATQVTYDLIRAGRSSAEILSETVRIHAPYTHVPYHQRMDGGFVRFVNNDHALLSARATLSLQHLMPDPLKHLPLAQTAWYVPSSLDIWNQLLGKVPGHYARRTYDESAHPDGPAAPAVHWDDQEAATLQGSFQEELERWQRLVEWGHVDDAYKLWLGLWQLPERREELLAHTMFAGLMDVQDRMIWNRSFTTGHKSYRQRSLIELGRAIGWDNAHHVIYAAVPDLAVGPRWYSNFEAACQIMQYELEDASPSSSLAATVASDTDRRLFANTTPVSEPEAEALIHVIMRGDESHFIDPLIALLRAGRAPRSVMDAIQIAAARVLMETRAPHAFGMPQHAVEYCNMVTWFFDNFDHPHRTKLLFVAANFINQGARYIRARDRFFVDDGVVNGPRQVKPPAAAESLSGPQILQRLEHALLTLDLDGSVDWTQAYLNNGSDRQPLIETLAVGAAKQGNDPHNQELGLCILEDYRRTSSPFRDTLLLASAHHTAGHIKYGDQFELLRHYGDAFGLPTDAEPAGGDDPAEAFLDDIEVELVADPVGDS